MEERIKTIQKMRILSCFVALHLDFQSQEIFRYIETRVECFKSVLPLELGIG